MWSVVKLDTRFKFRTPSRISSSITDSVRAQLPSASLLSNARSEYFFRKWCVAMSIPGLFLVLIISFIFNINWVYFQQATQLDDEQMGSECVILIRFKVIRNITNFNAFQISALTTRLQINATVALSNKTSALK